MHKPSTQNITAFNWYGNKDIKFTYNWHGQVNVIAYIKFVIELCINQVHKNITTFNWYGNKDIKFTYNWHAQQVPFII